MNRYWTLAGVPSTPWPTEATYVVAEAAMPVPGPNQALTRTISSPKNSTRIASSSR